MRSYSAQGIVLKRFNYSESDRIVTIFTKEHGKVSAIAKGVRKPTSKKKGSLEPATRARFHFARGKSLDILTQTELIDSYLPIRENLIKLTQVIQILEIIDLLLADRQEAPEVYQILTGSLQSLKNGGNHKQLILTNTRLVLKELGYTHDKEFSEHGLKNYIEELAGRKLRTKSFLTTHHM